MNEYVENRLSLLVGCNIQAVIEDTSGIPGLLVKRGKTVLRLWILSDEEGNGAGFPSVEVHNPAEVVHG